MFLYFMLLVPCFCLGLLSIFTCMMCRKEILIYVPFGMS